MEITRFYWAKQQGENYIEENTLIKGACRVAEFTHEGIEYRSILTKTDLHQKASSYNFSFVYQTKFPSGVWRKIDPDQIVDYIKNESNVNSNRFINPSNPNEKLFPNGVYDIKVGDADCAFEYDYENATEILDTTDPENPVSFNPKQYENLNTKLKNGVISMVDYTELVIKQLLISFFDKALFLEITNS